MLIDQETVTKSVINKYGTMVSNMSLENSVGFFDSNRSVQDFFVGLFELVYKFENLKELDKLFETTTFPAVDLADAAEGVAIQVTSRSDRKKIVDTIKTFNGNALYTPFPRLVIFILGNKKDYADFDDTAPLVFDKETDIWDTSDFVKDLNSLTYEELLLVDAYFDKYLASISVNQLYTDDIASGIKILDRDVHSILVKTQRAFLQARIPNRSPRFIEQKNKLNSLTFDEFIVIQGHLMHNKKIVAFLTDPINEDDQERYLRLADTIQQYYTSNREEYPTIDELMRYLFQVVNTYDDNIDSRKIQIILHNMYFNCDIGDNPNEN